MLERLMPEQQQKLRAILLKPRNEVTEQDILWSLDQSKQCGALDSVRLETQNHAAKASKALSQMPEGAPKKMLESLLGFLAEQRKV